MSEMQRIFVRQLRESMRRVTPGETVQQRDNALLADILRAFGSVRQADAMRVVISFVNSDRAQVREAARWAVSQYGRDTIHALRDAYEMYEGRDPEMAWGWERVARELYQAADRRHATPRPGPRGGAAARRRRDARALPLRARAPPHLQNGGGWWALVEAARRLEGERRGEGRDAVAPRAVGRPGRREGAGDPRGDHVPGGRARDGAGRGRPGGVLPRPPRGGGAGGERRAVGRARRAAAAARGRRGGDPRVRGGDALGAGEGAAEAAAAGEAGEAAEEGDGHCVGPRLATGTDATDPKPDGGRLAAPRRREGSTCPLEAWEALGRSSPPMPKPPPPHVADRAPPELHP